MLQFRVYGLEAAGHEVLVSDISGSLSAVADWVNGYNFPYKFDHQHETGCGCATITHPERQMTVDPVVLYEGPDIAGNTTTAASITVGGSLTSRLDTIGDTDWIRIELAAGDEISISLFGSGADALTDPLVRLYNSNGIQIAENDDGGSGYNSLLRYVVQTSGTYYIEADAWNKQFAGQYTLEVFETAPLEVYSIDQIAGHLTNGYWGGNARSFSIVGGQITYDISALPANASALAVQALELWSDVTGIVFVPVQGAGDITFQDTGAGAYASSVVSGSVIVSSIVNVADEWIAAYGTALDSYSFHTYIHEIGHALGLGHGGNYNGDASYALDALYANDAWSTTVMSYFDQNENYYFADLDFSRASIVSPMLADVVAITDLYGLASDTRSSATRYGFNSNSDRLIHNADLFPGVAYTIVDSGGRDTLDFSDFAMDQLIDLNPENFMNIGGLIGNISIGRGTVIEIALGGDGDDAIIGNNANNILRGGLGSDNIVGGSGVDRLYGASGSDSMNGGPGYDRLYGGGGQDNLVGGAGNDFLFGGHARDIIHGHNGNDEAFGGYGNDDIDGGEGKDILRGGDGNDLVVGGAGDDVLYGGDGSDQLFGGDDNDVICGENGNDEMTGGAGDDWFFFDSKGENHVDDILDFGEGNDGIMLDAAAFAAVTQGQLASSAFVAGGKALDSDDRIIYDQSTGNIYYDEDGSGSAAQKIFARVLPGTEISATDFYVGSQGDDAASAVPPPDMKSADTISTFDWLTVV